MTSTATVHYMQKNHTWKVAAATAPAVGNTLDILKAWEVLMIRPLSSSIDSTSLTEAVPGGKRCWVISIHACDGEVISCGAHQGWVSFCGWPRRPAPNRACRPC
ncbi:hypothetical protein [Xylella fastidiosa]|uniref:hypothetical protein n=1 Tax=Xylella fastidiosa TaxID=2371 RepID=UPI003AFA1876